jgi:hypothetical protein
MKPIEQLTNVERAKLLHELFPNEMPALLIYIKGVCEAIKENEQMQRSKWDDGFMDFDYWLGLLGEVDSKISRYGERLNQSAGLFADQLFSGMLALFTNRCIRLYTSTKVHVNGKFSMTVDVLFT